MQKKLTVNSFIYNYPLHSALSETKYILSILAIDYKYYLK